MRKANFYSLMQIGGKIQAVLHSGYTDGKYYYYREHKSDWCAIERRTGLGCGWGKTRKEAQEAVKRDERAIEAAITEEKIEVFQKCLRMA